MSRALLVALAGLLVTVGLARRADAQSFEITAAGLRTGASLDNDLTQFLIGGQLDIGRLAANLRVQPLLTLGFGDHATSLLAGAEAHVLFPVREARLEPYLGGGVGISHVSVDGAGRGRDETEAVLLLAGGVDIPMSNWWGYFAEARFVIGDQSVFRLEGGVNWVY